MNENEKRTKKLRNLNSIGNFPIAKWGADRIEELEELVSAAANSQCSDLRRRDEDGCVTNENRCDSCDGDGYHVTEIGTDYICDHCQGSGLLSEH